MGNFLPGFREKSNDNFLTKKPAQTNRSKIDTALAIGSAGDLITPVYGLIRQALTGGQGVVLPTAIYQQYDIEGILKRHGIKTWAKQVVFSGDKILFSTDAKRNRVYDILERECSQ